MATRSQKAALKRIKQLKESIRNNCQLLMSERRHKNRESVKNTLAEIEKLYNGYLAEAEQLVKDHDLENETLLDLQKQCGARIYKAADVCRQHGWQAAFAKRHGL